MQFLQKIPPWCDKMPKINLRDRGFIGLRKWNLGVVTSREEILPLILNALQKGEDANFEIK